MHIVAVYNNKGGVGKSTVTVGLAEFLSGIRRKRVLVIDMDTQASSACALLGRKTLRGALEKRRTLAALIRNIRENPRELTPAEVQQYVTIRRGVEGRGSVLRDISVLIPDGDEMAELDDLMSASSFDQLLLRTYLRPGLREYDFVLVDMPAAVKRRDVLQLNGLTMSDFVVIPVAPTAMALRALPQTVTVIDHARNVTRDAAANGSPEILGMLRNFTDRRTQQYKSHFREIEASCRQEQLPPLFTNYWPYTIEMQKATDDERDCRTLKQRFEGASYDAARLVALELEKRCESQPGKKPRGVLERLRRLVGV